MPEKDVVTQAEKVVRRELVELVGPRQAECLACFLLRVIPAFGCDNRLTWTHRWQGAMRSRRIRTSGLTAYVKSRGGYCDCEVLLNVYDDRLPEDDEPNPACTHGPTW